MAKYLIMIISVLIAFILSLPYASFGLLILKVYTVALLYNVGINVYVMLFMALLNRKKVDLTESVFSWQAKGSAQFLVVFILVLIPVAIYTPLTIFFDYNTGLLVVASIGVLGILLQPILMNYYTKQFILMKYQIAEGFHQS